MPAIIKFEQVNFAYNGDQQLVLKDITLDIMQKDFIGIIGPNGSGKTTLLKLILGLLIPLNGSITIFGEKPVAARKRIGYVPQFVTFNRSFPVTVADVVLMGRLNKSVILSPYTKKDRQIAADIALQLDIYDLWKLPIGELSGGQLQRVMLARALVSEPEILLLDEPTANIDSRAENNIFEFLKVLNKSIAIIVVSHDIGFVAKYIRRVACVNKTLVCHETEELSSEFIQQLYGLPMNLVRHDTRELTRE